MSPLTPSEHVPRTRLLPAILLCLLSACGGGPAKSGTEAAEKPILRLGYFPNITHATALNLIEDSELSTEIRNVATVESKVFNAGPAAIESILSGALDATYIGPNPAINAFIKSKGAAVRIVSGATSGGAFLIVKPEINSARDLKGKKVASPQRGNTQDVALRSWLASQGLKTDLEGGGDVSILPQENAQTLETFRDGQLSGAWVPEPWATRLILEGQGKVLVDERDLWPEGRYVTTHLLVRTDYLRQHPDVIEALLSAHVKAPDFVNNEMATAQKQANAAIGKVTGKELSDEVITKAWSNLVFTNDPIASSLVASAAAAKKLGLLESNGLDGLYDLRLLNKVLGAAGKEPVSE
ncbi:MAG: ABC transporter substrate-binding protein [Acidimicrobiia bacterium]